MIESSRTATDWILWWDCFVRLFQVFSKIFFWTLAQLPALYFLQFLKQVGFWLKQAKMWRFFWLILRKWGNIYRQKWLDEISLSLVWLTEEYLICFTTLSSSWWSAASPDLQLCGPSVSSRGSKTADNLRRSPCKGYTWTLQTLGEWKSQLSLSNKSLTLIALFNKTVSCLIFF